MNNLVEYYKQILTEATRARGVRTTLRRYKPKRDPTSDRFSAKANPFYMGQDVPRAINPSDTPKPNKQGRTKSSIDMAGREARTNARINRLLHRMKLDGDLNIAGDQLDSDNIPIPNELPNPNNAPDRAERDRLKMITWKVQDAYNKEARQRARQSTVYRRMRRKL